MACLFGLLLRYSLRHIFQYAPKGAPWIRLKNSTPYFGIFYLDPGPYLKKIIFLARFGVGSVINDSLFLSEYKYVTLTDLRNQ